MRYLFLLLLLLYSHSVSANLSEKFLVKFALPVNDKLVKQSINKEKARFIAKKLIIKKYLKTIINFPSIIKKNHKKHIIDLIIKSKQLKYKLINFKKEDTFKKNKSVFYIFSSNIDTDKLNANFEIWKFLNQLIIKKKLSDLLSLELALSYKDKINLLTVLQNWKESYDGGILYIVTDNLIADPELIKFIDKKFVSNDLSSKINEIVYLFDLAPLNIDICLKAYDLLNNQNYKTLAYKLLTSCKTVHLQKINKKDFKILNNEIKRLNKLNVNINEDSLINKIFNYQGNLPISLSQNNTVPEIDILGELIYQFEQKPNLYFLKKIRDKFKSMDFNLMNEYLTNQIGVSQNAGYKF